MSFRPNAIIAAIVLALFCARGDAATPVSATDEPGGGSQATSLADYRTRLESLDRLVAVCRQSMTAANCKSESVGPDAEVALPQGKRLVRFDWLRSVLAEAAEAGEKKSAVPEKLPEPADQPNSTSHKLTLPEQLQAARDRLHEDWMLTAGDATAESPGSAKPPRQALDRILAQKEFQYTDPKPTLMDRIREKLSRWAEKTFGALAAIAPRAKWVGLTLEIGVVVLVSVALAWFLISIERRSRLSAGLQRQPGQGAASARDWQLWLQDARQAAARGDWRDAIHLLYWASISRLESGGLWPADRARTPREYLALLGEENSHRESLGALTRSFERTWYAGQSSSEADFLLAEQLAGRLGAQ